MNSSAARYRYLAITQGTADWLQGKAGLIDMLFKTISASDKDLTELATQEFVDGPVHLVATSKLDLLALWNVDYLSGLGEERWGFIKLDTKLGLSAIPSIGNVVLERCLYVINQRLQGLLLDGALIHRPHPSGSHTCIAARGTEARQYNIGYFESNVSVRKVNTHAIIFAGPAHSFEDVSQAAANAAKVLPDFVETVFDLVSPKRNRPAASPDLFRELRDHISSFRPTTPVNEYAQVQVATVGTPKDRETYGRSHSLSYDEWISGSSSLSDVQRRILRSDALEQHPLRIVGPGGSGKTLLMQLLALRQLERAKQQDRDSRILYIVHNLSMQSKVTQRFATLSRDQSIFTNAARGVTVTTLLEYGRNELNLDHAAVIEPDAHTAKMLQFDEVTQALRDELTSIPQPKPNTLLGSVSRHADNLIPVLAMLIVTEISSVIKGHGLEQDRKRYVQSERNLSRFHGILKPDEREFVFNVFLRYHRAIFETYEVLDTDDVAVSLLGRLRTPMWELKRRKLGFDYILVDETQLFNENERRIFPYLTNGSRPHVPIALALDQAQDVLGQASAGLATLGIRDIANESLSSIHRSTRSIVKLAFFVIQRSTDLFGPDFPDFTSIADRMEEDSHPLAAVPDVIQLDKTQPSLSASVIAIVRTLRKSKLRQVAVICHSEQYWPELEQALRHTDLPLHILLERGERLPLEQPLVVLARPLQSGGQEFDAVVLVGLEHGIVPPRIADNEALSSAVEQQAIREMYLSITRARYRVSVVVSSGSTLTSILRDAERQRLLTRRTFSESII